MKKYFLIFPAIMLLAAGCGSSKSSQSDVKKTQAVDAISTSNENGAYTMAQVKAANHKDKCWSVVGNNVYDLTSWIDRHPGGAMAIMMMCGKDGTGMFTMQHGGQDRAESALAKLKIGTLSN